MSNETEKPDNEGDCHVLRCQHLAVGVVTLIEGDVPALFLHTVAGGLILAVPLSRDCGRLIASDLAKAFADA